MRNKKTPKLRYIAVGLIAGFVLTILFALSLDSIEYTESIGVVNIHGEIFMESTDPFSGYAPGVPNLINLLEQAESDEEVKVIFLDINSGGGSVIASKELQRAVRKLEKPVVAYISDIGASGAYYAASAADEIIADEDSLTGSIGTMMELQNLVGLMQKVGVNVTTITSGDMKSIGNPFEEFTEEQEELLQVIINDAFNSFKQDVLENRAGRISEKQFDSIADARILNGRQALAVGLIDYTGSRDFALERAQEIGGLETIVEKEFAAEGSPLAGLFAMAGKAFGVGMLQSMDKGLSIYS